MTRTNQPGLQLGIDNLEEMLDVLSRQKMILYPTDTIWGIGCDATSGEAIERIYQLKQRDTSKPFVLLASSIEMVKKYVKEVPPKIETLLAFHVRPLTVIYENAKNLPDIATGPNRTVAFRVVLDNFCRQLIDFYGKPLVATSANISNEAFPKHFGEISSAVIQGVDYVVKSGQEDENIGEPSVIVRIDGSGELEFLRS